MVQATATRTIVTQGDLGENVASFARHLRARNQAPKTVRTYLEGVARMAEYLTAKGMPTDIAAIRREHVESWIADLLEHGKPSSAANRFRSVQQLFKWAIEEGEIKESPMARMRPPTIPDEPPDVVREADLKKLLAACAGPRFEDRRDEAIIRLFIASGARLAEIAGLRWTPDDETTNDLALDGEIIRVMGKGRRERIVNIGRKGAYAAGRYTKLRDRHNHRALPWLWLSSKGQFTASGIAQMVKERGRAAGLGGGVHPHQFRHSYAHSMLAAGMQEGDLMAQAGWRSREMLSRYARSTAAERSIEAAKRINPGDRL
jgi:site-specific recombinase XerD